MWFKNLLAYRFTSPFTLSGQELAEKLEDFRFVHCGRHEQSRTGWVSPLGDKHETLIHEANGCILLCLRKEEKILPATVIRDQLQEKVDAIEAKEDRKVYRKEKDNLKEEILHDCLPRAFTRSRRTFAFIAPLQGWFFVDASAAAKAEDLMKQLREAIGTLPAVPIQVQSSPAVVMTEWLKQGKVPDTLILTDESEMREPGEGGSVVRCKNQDLLSEEIDSHLNAGKQVVKLGLEWDEQIRFLLNEDFSLNRLKFSEKLTTEAEHAGDGDALAKLDADFALMSAALNQLVPALIAIFGDTKDPV